MVIGRTVYILTLILVQSAPNVYIVLALLLRGQKLKYGFTTANNKEESKKLEEEFKKKIQRNT